MNLTTEQIAELSTAAAEILGDAQLSDAGKKAFRAIFGVLLNGCMDGRESDTGADRGDSGERAADLETQINDVTAAFWRNWSTTTNLDAFRKYNRELVLEAIALGKSQAQAEIVATQEGWRADVAHVRKEVEALTVERDELRANLDTAKEITRHADAAWKKMSESVPLDLAMTPSMPSWCTLEELADAFIAANKLLRGRLDQERACKVSMATQAAALEKERHAERERAEKAEAESTNLARQLHAAQEHNAQHLIEIERLKSKLDVEQTSHEETKAVLAERDAAIDALKANQAQPLPESFVAAQEEYRARIEAHERHKGGWENEWRTKAAIVLAEEALKLKAAPQQLAIADGPCAFCGEQTNSVAGDPGEWPLWFCHFDGTGKTKPHHARCVTERLFKAAPVTTESVAPSVGEGYRRLGPEDVDERYGSSAHDTACVYRRKIEAQQPNCRTCDDKKSIDSGGVDPVGHGIDIACPDCTSLDIDYLAPHWAEHVKDLRKRLQAAEAQQPACAIDVGLAEFASANTHEFVPTINGVTASTVSSRSSAERIKDRIIASLKPCDHAAHAARAEQLSAALDASQSLNNSLHEQLAETREQLSRTRKAINVAAQEAETK